MKPEPGTELTAKRDATGEGPIRLSEVERDKIRQEAIYLSLILGQKPPSDKSPSFANRVARVSNSGIGLLLIGTLVGSIVIPHFQKRAEEARQDAAHAQEILSHFLVYANTPWEEYHIVIPLTVNPHLDRSRYESILNAILAVKLRRYDAFASLEAQAATFRSNPNRGALSSLLDEYAGAVDKISGTIARSLGHVYCANGNCVPESQPEEYVPISKIEDQIHALDKKQQAIAILLTSVGRQGGGP